MTARVGTKTRVSESSGSVDCKIVNAVEKWEQAEMANETRYNVLRYCMSGRGLLASGVRWSSGYSLR